MSMTSKCFSTVSIFPLSFLLTRASVMNSILVVSFLVDDLMKGLLALASTATVGEGKSNFLPLFIVVLAEGISVNFGVGWHENSL